jgi:abhydrolase domain-containing protein 17
LPNKKFKNLYFLVNVKKVEVPVLVIHGTQDNVINVSHGRELSNIINKEIKFQPLFIEGAGHNDIERLYSDVFFNQIKLFISFLLDDHKTLDLKKKTVSFL